MKLGMEVGLGPGHIVLDGVVVRFLAWGLPQRTATLHYVESELQIPPLEMWCWT